MDSEHLGNRLGRLLFDKRARSVNSLVIVSLIALQLSLFVLSIYFDDAALLLLFLPIFIRVSGRHRLYFDIVIAVNDFLDELDGLTVRRFTCFAYLLV